MQEFSPFWFVAGLIVGWLVQWLFIDIPFYRRTNDVASRDVSPAATPRLLSMVPVAEAEAWRTKAAEADTLRAQLEAAQSQLAVLDPGSPSELEPVTSGDGPLGPKGPSASPSDLAATSNPPAEVRSGTGRAADPLEKLIGIGPAFEQKLHEAGILTFAQLAASSPARIFEIIQPEPWQKIDPEKWIEEAKRYARGERR